MTILPELAAKEVPLEKRHMLRSFSAPVPVREISMVTHRQFIKKKLVDALVSTILSVLPDELKEKRDAFVVPF